MRKMKNSKIEWVGEIPENWEVKPIRALFVENNNKNVLGKETKALQFKFGEIVPKKNFNAADDEYVADTILKYNIVDKDMIVINGLNLNFDFVTKRVGLVKERGIITSAYMSFYIKDKKSVSPNYANYLLKSYDNCTAFHNMGGGVRKILTFEELKHNLFLLPPLTEQKEIAEYLDEKCGEIDALLADIKDEIETLEQYKRSVITESVTKGLNPSAPMKNSGIDYIGEVNEEWRITKLGYICQKLNRPIMNNAEALICSNKGKVVFRGDISLGLSSENDKMYQGVEKGDLCIHGMDTWHGAIAVAEMDGKITTVVHCCDSKENKRFIAYYLQMLAFKKVYKTISNGVRGNTSDFRSWDKAAAIYIALPRKEQQDIIANYLDEKCFEIENIISDKQTEIQTLESYKKSLIYEYVTGKKEVKINEKEKTIQT